MDKDNPTFSVGAEGVNAEKIMSEIKVAVAGKAARGVYRDLRVAQAERANLVNLSDDESFLKYYLECLRNAVFVDINDFEIRERRRFGSAFFVAFKKIVWSILKFYTYRLWSQQNQINGLLVTAIESMDEKYRARCETLERKLAAPEDKNKAKNICHKEAQGNTK
ncbi:MAG: hypothetical protein Q7J98_10170 [Kiritimatiellia bacterium]|nr:hypothetical protein [Kiritimatiellia bacterium]